MERRKFGHKDHPAPLTEPKSPPASWNDATVDPPWLRELNERKKRTHATPAKVCDTTIGVQSSLEVPGDCLMYYSRQSCGAFQQSVDNKRTVHGLRVLARLLSAVHNVSPIDRPQHRNYPAFIEK